MRQIFINLFFIFSFTITAQETQSNKVNIDFSGFIDTFYSYDFDEPENGSNYTFLYNYNRHNEFNINMALLRASINYQNMYAKISFHAGTYVNENYASEDIKFLNEAYVGVYLDKNKKATLEAGILPSYIGFETAISHANLTATRSILAENSPYYMAGVKLNYQFNDKFSLAFLATNGWQHIKKMYNKLPPALGTQLVYKSSPNSLFNWSTFVGKELYNNEFTPRFFNNIYWDKSWTDKWHMIAGFDLGFQKMSLHSNEYASWLSPILINQYKLQAKWNIAHRIEYYNDEKNVIVSTATPFKILGNSINLDFLPNSKVKIRTEAKWFHASENIFRGESTKDNFDLTATLSVEF